MPFNWNSVGSKPGANEPEVTVIGPGYGESMVIHVGNGRWMIVDSCIDTSTGSSTPAPLLYLEALGVDPTKDVDCVVATHWHRDHVRGLAKVLQRCTAARFSCSQALLNDEFAAYIATTGRILSAMLPAPNEFLECFRVLGGRSARWATAGREIFTWGSTAAPICRVVALSPSDAEHDRFLKRIAASMPTKHEAKRAAPPGDRNEVSLVVQVCWPDFSVLLGADMTVVSDAGRGWKAAMLEHKALGLPRSIVVKVPHHGSLNAHFQPMWDDGLETDRIAVVAPFGRGPLKGRPPSIEDIRRIAKLAPRSYLTSSPRAGTRGRMDSTVERTLEEGGIELTLVNPRLGLVQLRRAAGLWTHRLFAPAMELDKAA